MSDQLNKIRTAAHEKLKKESEVVVEVQKPSSLQTAAVDYLSRKEEPHPLSSPKNINESVTEGKMNDLHMYIKQGKTAKEIGKLMGVDPKTIQKLMSAYDAKNESLELDEKPADFIRLAFNNPADVKKARKWMDQNLPGANQGFTGVDYGIKDIEFEGVDDAEDLMAKLKKAGFRFKVDYREEVELDEGKFKVGDTVIPSVGPHKGRKHEVIADLKNNTYNIKPIGLLAKQIQYRLGAAKAKANQIKLVKEETLDEREKSVRQLVNPTKEVMVVKKNKVVVIDKKDQDKYIKQGWTLAEENELEEARWKVKIEGLPSMYMDSSSAGEVKSQLRKLLKKPDMIQDIERVTDADMKKGLKDRISGKEVEEKLDKDDEEEVQDVIKGLKKAVKAHGGQVKDLEKAVNEWFKEKNIDVKVRKLEESTQVYVPIGRRIPNEIREELITTQYGKMPEDVKNVKDINYGNFMENSITMNNDFWSKVLHGTKGE